MDKTKLPRVVIELKGRVSTHDVLAYSAKALMHKRLYPYLRYGLIVGAKATLPAKLFWHNEGFDFCIAAAGLSRAKFQQVMKRVFTEEIAASHEMEKLVGSRKTGVYLYQRGVRAR